SVLRALYFPQGFGTLRSGAGSNRDGVAAPVADVAGAVRRRLRASESARCVASVCDRSAERQSAQVDGSDVGAPERSGHLSSLSALHYACAVGGRRGLDAVAGGGAGSDRGPDPRWHELSQTGP